jgi:hypothetical protein
MDQIDVVHGELAWPRWEERMHGFMVDTLWFYGGLMELLVGFNGM